MAEDIEQQASEAVEPPAQAAPAAVALALGRASASTSAELDQDAASFLRRQSRLIDLQTEHLHEQRELILSRLRWGRFSDRLKAALQLMTGVVGLVIVGLVVAMAWQAHETHGLVIDAFSVPPQLAQGGLTGQVAASRFLDKLQALQTATAGSDRPAQSFESNWGSDFKVEIPETGLTFSEFDKLLREKLGHVSHVTGEVLRTPTGIALTARYGEAPPQTFTGADADFDVLAQKAAEAVYRASQPYRYAEYLEKSGRVDEAIAVVSDLAANGPRSERGWAYGLWARIDLNHHGDVVTARTHFLQGFGYGAGSDLTDRISLVNTEVWSGHEEADLQVSKVLEAEAQQRLPDTSEQSYRQNKLLGRAWLDFITPDYPASAAAWNRTGKEDASTLPLAVAMEATADALGHDLAAARRAAGSLQGRDETSYMWRIVQGAFQAFPSYWLAAETGDWPTALARARAVDGWLEANRTARPIYAQLQKVWIRPLEALAQARTGDLAGAGALIADTPTDCYLCLWARGVIAAQAHDGPAADRWFAEAVRQAPSPPFAYAEWGRALLDRGDPRGAVARLAVAAAKGPRFADPRELWGEALMRQGDHAGAADQFRQADQLAPHWGRNHLMWGQALMLAGRYRLARAQFEAANGLELSRPDRAALDVLLARTARGPLRG